MVRRGTTRHMCYLVFMGTARKRVNLTLTEMEERFLDAITTSGTPEHGAYLRHLGADDPGSGAAEVPEPTYADAVHVVLRLGLGHLESELAEISYAAEAAEHGPADRALAAARRARLAAAALRTDG